MFKHYLITRFNLRNPNWNKTKNNESLLTDEWMSHRISLFSDFCLPSIIGQSNSNFKWIICFDTTTKPEFKEQILTLISPHKHIVALFVDGMNNFLPTIVNYIGEDAKSCKHIITSRIDNDDCIHKDYIESIQKTFNHQDFMAIDVVKGYSLQISPKFYLGKKEHVFNPFISLIENIENLKTVWQSDHNMWKKENRIIKITNKRLWMSIIHEKNKINEFDGYDNVDWKKIKNNFKLSDSINQKIKESLTPYSEWRFLSFKNKLYVKYILFSKTLKKSLGLYKLKK